MSSTRAAAKRLKPLAAALGLRSSKQLFEGLALRRHLQKQRTDPEYQEWLRTVGERWLEWHWGHTDAGGPFDRAHVASQLYELTELLRRRMRDIGEARVLDAGASDGMFLTRVGARHGVGVNLLRPCASRVRADGFHACIADVGDLPFPDRAFDYVICCETLEHVPNPVAAITELLRVCRTRLHLTIPWIANTRINARAVTWPECETHVFEFNERDFSRILTHVPARVTWKSHVQVFPEPANPITQWWLRTWMYSGYFPKLQYYELEPVPRMHQHYDRPSHD